MNLKEWRVAHDYTQVELAAALEKHASAMNSACIKKLPQRTLSSWERGCLPRKFWINVILDFTKNKVNLSSFASDVPQ